MWDGNIRYLVDIYFMYEINGFKIVNKFYLSF